VGPRWLAPVERLYPALAVSNYRLLWFGMLPSTLAWQMSVVASGYAAFVISGSATVLGIVSLAVGLPMLLFSLVGGVVADRFPRRTILLLTQGIFGLASGAIAVLAFAGRLEVWHLIALGLVQGTALCFNVPARQSYIGELVEPRLLRNAVAINNAGMNFTRIAGPSLAGILLAIPVLGVGGVFGVMTTMYAVVLAALARLPARSELGHAPGRGAGWAELVEGLRYIRSSGTLMALLGLALVPLTLGLPYQTLMPLFAERVFHVGAVGLGALMAAIGIGSLAGAITIATLSDYPRPARLQLMLGVGFGLALVAFGLAPALAALGSAVAFVAAILCLATAGFCSAGYNALNNTLVMGNTEPRLHGRVMSVYLLTFAVMPLGSVPAAWLADHIGGPLTIILAGGSLAAIVVAVALLYPPYRHIR
jgi:MFS family permease